MTEKILITVGDYLKIQYLDDLGLSVYALAKHLDVPQSTMADIMKGKTRLSPELAYRLGVFFKTGTHYWLDLQALCDSQTIEAKHENNPVKIVPFDAVFA